MRKQHAGAHLHLCLPAPQAPPAPCRCLPTPGTCPQALHQNPRRLPEAPAGNTSGTTATNMHKPLRTMYRFLGHKQAPPSLEAPNVKCCATLRARHKIAKNRKPQTNKNNVPPRMVGRTYVGSAAQAPVAVLSAAAPAVMVPAVLRKLRLVVMSVCRIIVWQRGGRYAVALIK